jgi:hypothetical protein
MKAEDRLSLSDGTFDRDAWAALWDRLPERMRRGAAEFVLQKLHALESGGDWRIAWHYESTEHREESDAPTFEFDQPGDVITFLQDNFSAKANSFSLVFTAVSAGAAVAGSSAISF